MHPEITKDMKKLLMLPLLALFSCQRQNTDLIYENSSYQWYPDRIVQGEFVGTAETACRIVSDYDGDTLVWECRNDISAMPVLTAPTLLEEAVYNMAIDECIIAVEPDGTLRTGLFWGGVWTRDVSYSTILSMAYIQPQAAMTSLLCKIGPTGLIIQDTGTGGAWPCSTDRQVWTMAAWELYKVTGDREWLAKVYPVAKKSLIVDMKTLYDAETGLVRGESSFIDWREQSYPRWMEPADIYDSKCLGTNVVHYAALMSAAEMARLSDDAGFAGICLEKAAGLKDAINEYLWMEDMGYYAQYIAGRNQDIPYTKSETLGQALAVLYGVAEGERATKLSESMPVVDFGAPVFYPWIPDIPPYHNRAVWPFVQSFWMQACARSGNEAGVLHGIGSLYRAAAMYATNKENFVADEGNWKGTQINSSNMLWSLSGALSITYKVLLGMEWKSDALCFAPVVPRQMDGVRKVTGFKYRNATLDLEVVGHGDSIRSFELDGVEQEEACIPAGLEGKHSVRMVLSGSFARNLKVNLQPGRNTPMTPSARLEDGLLSWDEVEGAASYVVYVAGKKHAVTSLCSMAVPSDLTGDVQVVAMSADGVPSFPSEPVYAAEDTIFKGFRPLMLKKGVNESFSIDVDVPEDGVWYLSWNYANGNGDITTDRKCAIRTLYADGKRVDICVFPQRGVDNWQEWGMTSPVPVTLAKGRHTFTLCFEPENENMHIDVNEFKIKGLRLSF